jgi:hypothetical protein
MTALLVNRLSTNNIAPFPYIYGLVAAGVHIFQNALIECVDGYWQPATAAPDRNYAVAIDEADNTLGLDGAKRIQVEFIKPKRLWLAKNDAGSPIAQAQIGGEGWVLDDQTVGATGAVGTHTRVIPWQFYEANLKYDITKIWVEVL